MIGGLESVYVREIRLWRRFEVVSSIETWEGTQVIGRHRFVLDNGETAALIMTTGGVYDRPGRRFVDIDEVVAALGRSAQPRAADRGRADFMTSHQGLRGLAKRTGLIGLTAVCRATRGTAALLTIRHLRVGGQSGGRATRRERYFFLFGGERSALA